MPLDPLLNSAPDKISHIHIMGICGTGMAALAGILKEDGYIITGSDQNIYPPMSDFLKRLQIKVKKYSPNNLLPNPDLVIVGNVIRELNPEALALAENRIHYLSMPQALATFYLSKKTPIVITGTHGKTTTSSMLASTLKRAEKSPSFMIGGVVKDFNTNFSIGNGKYFIVEGDEYDTAFFDKESKFLHYLPQIAVITSLEFDHADIFTDLNAIKSAFRKFVKTLPKDGLLIANFDDPNVVEILSEAKCKIESYGLSTNYDWSLSDIKTYTHKSTFTIRRKQKSLREFTLAMTGKHNCLNAVSIAAILYHIGLSPQTINDGLMHFGGIKRRQEIRGIVSGVTIIDDFAHHPTAVKETLQGLKKAYENQRLIAVFEPRTNSSRRAIFQKDYIYSFDSADIILIKEPILLDNVDREDHFSSQRLAKDLTNRGKISISFENTDDIIKELINRLTKGDVVPILSNGGFDNIHERLLAKLR